MPVNVSSFLLPRNNQQWYIVEDIYLRGGLRIVANAQARDSIHVSSKKPHMLVITADDGRIWQLQPDNQTWADFRPKTQYFPFFTYDQPDAAKTWRVEHNRNTKYFNFTLFQKTGESSSELVMPDAVRIVDDNVLEFDFNVPIAGHVTLTFAEMS